MNQFLELLIDLLFPQQCCNCWRIGAPLCEKCSKTLEPVLLPFTLKSNKNTILIRVHAAVSYTACTQKILFHLKFLGVKSLSKSCAYFILSHCTPPPGAHYLVPIPVHHKRLASRGFNQALEITRYLSTAWQIPILNCLERCDYSSASSKKSRNQRLETPRSFRVIPAVAPPPGSHLILVDDVVTTGITLYTAATALQTHCPQRVSAICFTASL